jgi:hypothetical protein
MTKVDEQMQASESMLSRELADLLATRTPRELMLAARVLRALFDELDPSESEDSD